MSVINKMLRDLDQRQVADDNEGALAPGATPLRSGTASVPGRQAGRAAASVSRRSKLSALVGLSSAGLAVCGAAAWWWLQPQAASPLAAVRVAQAPTAAGAPAPAGGSSAIAPTAPQVALLVATAPVVAATLPVAPPVAASSAPKVLTAIAPPAPAPTTVPVPGPAPASAMASAASPSKPALPAPGAPAAPTASVTKPMATVNQAAMAPPVSISAPASASVPAPHAPVIADAVSTGQRQQQAARDALAQAQGLWNAGAHDNAIDLLQQAVATAERSAQSTPGAPATQALTSLARELARLQVAQGRPAAGADTLARLEPLLGADPDIWALRANAAQRAGRHQESVNAYVAALQSRPGEQRWLLGAAVSSAALGQAANAATFADKAAAAGPIAKDVQAYLRQMGVPLKD